MNRTLIRFTTLPSRLPHQLRRAALYAAPVALLANQAFAQAANTLGGRMQAASTDLTTGGGFVLEILGYLFGGAALLAGFYTIWQHSKNPNGQMRFGYGLTSIVVGGAFLAASLFGGFAAQTVAGAGVTNTGAPKAMTFN